MLMIVVIGSGCGLFAGALLRAGREPAQHIEFGVPDAARAGRAEEARPFATEAILVEGVGMDPEDHRDLLRIKRAALGGVGEQLTKLIESRLGHGVVSRNGAREKPSGASGTARLIRDRSGPVS